MKVVNPATEQVIADLKEDNGASLKKKLIRLCLHMRISFFTIHLMLRISLKSIITY